MKAGKDYLADKPGITSLEQLAEVRKAIKDNQAQVRHHVFRAARSALRGARRRTDPARRHRQGHPDREPRAASRERAEPARSGSSTRRVTAASSATSARTRPTSSSTTPAARRRTWWPRRPATSPIRTYPKFEDFGDMIMTGNGGTGYVRVDWFTPDGLDTWGDGRLFILGTEGYIELRKYTNVAVGQGRQSPVHRRQESRRATSTATRCRCRSVRSSCATSSNAREIAQNQAAGAAGHRAGADGAEDRDAAHRRLKDTGGIHEDLSRARCAAALFVCAVARADESAGPLYVPYQRLGHLRARRDRRLARHAALGSPSPQLRDPQEQSRRDRPRHDPAGQAREHRGEARRARHGVRRSHREHAGRQAEGAGRRGRAGEDPALDPRARGLRCVLEGEDRGAAQGAHEAAAHRQSPARRTASISPS